MRGILPRRARAGNAPPRISLDFRGGKPYSAGAMKILCIGDVVGAPGRRVFASVVPKLRAAGEVQAVIVNGENAAAGRGITPALADELLDAGADAITLGDHAWDQKEALALAASDRPVVRPANCGSGAPGRGWRVVSTPVGRVCVVNLLGRVFMNPADNPFEAVDALLAGPVPRDVPVLVDFHAEATSEKIAMGWHLDGRVAAVFGTHTHVQTADAAVLPKGTGYITDLGMCGPVRSVIGREVAPVVRKFLGGMPQKFDVAGGPAALTGCVFDVDPATRLCRAAAAVRFAE